MFTPKIIFFDIDDTLYRKESDTVRPSVALALRALKARGILTAIATGRPPVAIPPKIKALIAETGTDMLVTINGQYVEFRGKPLHTAAMNTDTLAAMAAYFDGKNIPYAFVNHAEIAVSEPVPQVETALADILPVHPTDKYYFRTAPVYQMLAFYSADRDQEVAGDIAAAGLQTVRWHKQAVDMLPVGHSKAQGITAAIAKLGIAMQDVMAFGDGLNDVEMLQSVGFGVAMGNGAAAAKAAARHICPSVDEDGVYRGLKDLGIIDG
ncbi:Cof-type HAD-IIB family hydrolase [Neisseria animalis]|uniref:Cof-type HAD-IIB family hydrolase n=1 Tax=Neisseria animalis TaxID=492 RepID=A0A5P3MRN2_NEIAN|nr:Cof-type HAD-IIB family hydrolase [Neisseria animalis]QEY23299.1 Cof-type HAD-IIB family hydrolase [Neisseria animalis]ROW31947.1 Cof-type HAD-IIB family hydrolase [Neisseria animalis]VEE08617.1 HAD hydrolase [Neisseria animalis]